MREQRNAKSRLPLVAALVVVFGMYEPSTEVFRFEAEAFGEQWLLSPDACRRTLERGYNQGRNLCHRRARSETRHTVFAFPVLACFS